MHSLPKTGHSFFDLESILMLYRTLCLALSFLSLASGCAKKQLDASHAAENAVHPNAEVQAPKDSPLQYDLANATEKAVHTGAEVQAPKDSPLQSDLANATEKAVHTGAEVQVPMASPLQSDLANATEKAVHTGAEVQAPKDSPLQCDLAKGNPLFRNGQSVLIENYRAEAHDELEEDEDPDEEKCGHANTNYVYLDPPYAHGPVCYEISTEKCVTVLKVANDQACVSQVFCDGTLKGNIYLDKEMVGFVLAKNEKFDNIHRWVHSVIPKDGTAPSGEEIQQWVDTLQTEVKRDAYERFAGQKGFSLAFREEQWEDTYAPGECDECEGILPKGWTTLEGNTWTDEQFGDSEYSEQSRVIYDPEKGVFSFESCITQDADGIRIVATDK